MTTTIAARTATFAIFRYFAGKPIDGLIDDCIPAPRNRFEIIERSVRDGMFAAKAEIFQLYLSLPLSLQRATESRALSFPTGDVR